MNEVDYSLEETFADGTEQFSLSHRLLLWLFIRGNHIYSRQGKVALPGLWRAEVSG